MTIPLRKINLALNAILLLALLAVTYVVYFLPKVPHLSVSPVTTQDLGSGEFNSGKFGQGKDPNQWDRKKISIFDSVPPSPPPPPKPSPAKAKLNLKVICIYYQVISSPEYRMLVSYRGRSLAIGIGNVVGPYQLVSLEKDKGRETFRFLFQKGEKTFPGTFKGVIE